tara:strand:- start:337 stop:1233 length:897 start_codon:yes stop_codon:yes gene_type:complete
MKHHEVAVGVDLLAGTQSARRAMEEQGLFYVPIDIRPKVYSAVEEDFVYNLEADLLHETPETLYRKVRQYIKEKKKLKSTDKLKIRLVFTTASPDCSTFSRLNDINRNRNCCYRDTTHPDAPPVKYPPEYRKRAILGDLLVKKVKKILFAWYRHSGKTMKFVVENPDAYLKCRPYMKYKKCWVDDVYLHKVDYCAYNHFWKKPTDIWTNIGNWKPKGMSGNGRCNNDCKYGSFCPVTSRFRHSFEFTHRGAKTIHSRATKRRMGVKVSEESVNRGHGARRIMVPHLLHAEIMAAALRK